MWMNGHDRRFKPQQQRERDLRPRCIPQCRRAVIGHAAGVTKLQRSRSACRREEARSGDRLGACRG
jgi:hypothetical protein